MKKTLIIIVIIIIVIAGYLLFNMKRGNAPTANIYNSGPSATPESSASIQPSPTPTPNLSTSSPKPTPTQANTRSTRIVTYQNGAISPNSITIKSGDTVKFVNNDSTPHWPASDPHPAHNICQGFDALSGLQTGQSYSRIFDTVKTCPFHDHLDPSNQSLRGQIVVTQ